MKARILALCLSVAVAFSGIPAMNVSANPLAEEIVVETIETEEESSTEADAEETTETIEEEIVETMEEETSTEEASTEETAVIEESTVIETMTEEEISEEVETEETTIEETTMEESTAEELSEEVETETVALNEIDIDMKAVGSNGVTYEGVTYLSAVTVNALPKNAQEAYREMCDTIAEWHENGTEVKNIVIAADAESLTMSYKIPVNMLFSEEVQSSFIPEENMELISSYEKMEDVSGVPFIQYDTLLKNESYYKNQLSSNAKLFYDAGKKAFVQEGKNYVTVTYNGYVSSWGLEPLDGVSALVNTYPNSFNWMDLGDNGGIEGSGTYYYRTNKAIWNYTIGKSKWYSSSLETQADQKVAQLVTAAQNYAKTNYPDNHVYGIIKYFDKWICENNYYSSAGLKNTTSEAYFYCHSCYGILLKGYGVCESYALAMTRLLDAVGIRNMYVVGDAGGGHAWNHVEMPDGKWYLLDSTWNDSGRVDGAASAGSTGDYLLVPNDGVHKPEGRRFVSGKKFKYYAYDCFANA